MKPVIGVTLRYDRDKDKKTVIYIFDSLRRSIQKLGGEILFIPPVVDVDSMDTPLSKYPKLTDSDKNTIDGYLKKCDGIVFPGGIKFLPSDEYILDYVIKNDIPTLGFCLGMQMMSCYKEEILLERNSDELNSHCDVDKDYLHDVMISKDSKLYEIIGKEKIAVNSMHNYHALENHLYKTVAYSDDGLIEAIEYPGLKFNIGVQWHPEKMIDYDENSKKLLNAFIECSKEQMNNNTLVK